MLWANCHIIGCQAGPDYVYQSTCLECSIYPQDQALESPPNQLFSTTVDKIDLMF